MSFFFATRPFVCVHMHQTPNSVGGSALARESMSLLGRWQRRVGVGTLLRQAADASGRAACLRPRVTAGGRQQRLLLSGHVTGGAGQKWGEAAVLALLVLLGSCLWAMVGCWSKCVGGRCRGVSGGALVGRWRCDSFGAGALVSEEEGPNNQHEWKR
jgi:hypothetical protein